MYFNNGTNVICFPINCFQGMLPRDDDKLELYFHPISEEGYAPGKDNFVIELTLNTNNKHKEVMTAISEAIVFPETPVVVIFDSTETSKVSEYIDSFTGTASNDP